MHIFQRFSAAALLFATALLLAGCDSVEERAEKHFQSALQLIEEGDLDRAIVELRNVFELDGRRTDARRTMAELQLQKGNKQVAYAHYATLAELDPTDIESRIILSEMAFEFGSWEELDRHGAQAEELAPEDPRVKAIVLTRAYRTAANGQDPTERRKLVVQAEEMLEDQPDNLFLRNVIMDNAIRDQDLDRALEEIDWILAQDATRTRYYQERLRVLAMQGDMYELEKQLRELVELFPDDPGHKGTLISFLMSREDLDGAEAFLRKLADEAEPEMTGPRVDLIRFYAETDNIEAARAELSKAISESADPTPYRILEAGFRFSAGERSEAIATLQNVLEASEPDEDGKMTDQTQNVKVVLAQMLLQTGNEVGARTQVEELLAENATHPEALKMQAAWQIQADDTQAAISGLRLVIDQKPDDANAMILMARAYARAGQPDLERDYMAQAVQASGNAAAFALPYAQRLIAEDRLFPAEDVLRSALRTDSSDPSILVMLGRLYLRMEDFGRVQGVIDTLRRIGNAPALQAANGLEAEKFNQQKGTDAAISFLENLANEADASVATRISLVNAKIRTGETEAAVSLARELLEGDPKNRALRVVLAVALSADNDHDGAIEIYRGLVEEEPRLAGIWVRLIRTYLAKGERDAARAAIEDGLSHSPGYADLLWAKASLAEGDGDINTAIEIYETLYARNSNDIVVANNLASLLSRHRTDEENLERAWIIGRRLKDNDLPAFQDTFGWILHLRGGSAEALPILESAADGLPRDPIAQYHLGQVYLAVDRPADALEQFLKAVDIAGEVNTAPQIEEARRLIQTLREAEAAQD